MPDVNRSDVEFVPKDGAIPYALGAIRNVGSGAMQALVQERDANGPFKSLADFSSRIDPRQINKRAMENLICAGALDIFDPSRARLSAGADRILGEAIRLAEDRATNQGGLFGGDDNGTGDLGLRVVDDWLPMEKLNRERDAIGFYLSSHPLEEYEAVLRRSRAVTYAETCEKTTSGTRNIVLAGTVGKVQMKRSARGNPFAFVQMSDSSGSYEVTVFSEALNANRDLLEPGNNVLLSVEAEMEAEQLRIRVNSIRSLDSVVADSAAGLRIFLRDEAPLKLIGERLPGKGKGRVSLVLMTEGEAQEIEMDLPQPYAITPQIKAAIKAVPGVVEVQEI
jgi:DNA polymerase-3 subunit alpha